MFFENSIPATSQTTAVVGSSGSGKSTLIHLLERFYDATGGAVEMDGYNIQNLNPVWFHAGKVLVLAS
jgi:ABC-type multidrug transport system fused ATPase/permease subunit